MGSVGSINAMIVGPKQYREHIPDFCSLVRHYIIQVEHRGCR